MRLTLTLILSFALMSPLLAGDTSPARSRASRLLDTNYAPPFPVRTSSWYLQGVPISHRERMRQSLCCAMLPVMCGKPGCFAAAMTYANTSPKHLDPDYLRPFHRAPDPAQEVRSMIFWAMNPVPTVRTDFLPTYRLYVLGADAAPHQ